MTKIIEIFAAIILILIITSIVMMPWPANIILGGIALSSCIVAIIYGWQGKKKEQDTEPTDKTKG